MSAQMHRASTKPYNFAVTDLVTPICHATELLRRPQESASVCAQLLPGTCVPRDDKTQARTCLRACGQWGMRAESSVNCGLGPSAALW